MGAFKPVSGFLLYPCRQDMVPYHLFAMFCLSVRGNGANSQMLWGEKNGKGHCKLRTSEGSGGRWGGREKSVCQSSGSSI